MKKRFLAAALALGLVMGSVSVSAATKDPNPTRVNTYSTGGKAYFNGKTTTFVDDGDGIDTVREASDTFISCWGYSGNLAKSTVYVSEARDFIIMDENGVKSIKVGSKTIKCGDCCMTSVKVSKSCKVKVTDQRGDTASVKVVVDSRKPTVSLSQSKGTLKVRAKDNAQLKTIYVEEGYSQIYKKDSKGKSARVSFDVSKYSGKKLTVSVYDCAGNWVEKEITIK